MTYTFPSVSTNNEKYLTYKQHMSRLKRAKTEGFYLEGIFIVYAMLEDRFSAFLYYAGVTNKTRDKLTKNKTIRPQLEQVVPTKNLSIRNISSKRCLMKSLIDWSGTYAIGENSVTYLDVLCKQINRTTNKIEIISTLDEIENWCKSRNELVHALLNKKIDQQEETLKQLVENGSPLSRNLDNFVQLFKNRNTIRKQFNIQ